MMDEDGTKAVDLQGDESLKVNIADALNEQDVVKFTVHTKTTLDRFQKREFQVTRQHEEFVWLHDRYVENEAFAGLVIPPCPPKPNFSQSHGKLAKLQANSDSMPQEEMEKLKQEIQGEYLAAFQKTVAMHEVFLLRVTSHPLLREDSNLQVFLEYDKDLACRGRSKKDNVVNFFKSAIKVVDEAMTKHVDSDQFFEHNKNFIAHYGQVIAESASKSESKVKARGSLVVCYDRLGTALIHLANTLAAFEDLSSMLRKTGENQNATSAIEKKLTAREDLKMTDLLRYYVADTEAAKDLLWRRIKAFGDMDSKKKAWEQAKLKGKKVLEAQDASTQATERFDKITASAREELQVFQKRRLAAFRKGLIQYTQCQIRQAKEHYNLCKASLQALKECQDKSATPVSPTKKPVYGSGSMGEDREYA